MRRNRRAVRRRGRTSSLVDGLANRERRLRSRLKPPELGWPGRYTLALVILCAGIGAAIVVRDPTRGALSPLLGAVVLIVWICGMGPAVLALAATAWASAFFLMEPRYSVDIANRSDIWRWLSFVAVSSLVVGLGLRMRVERDRDRRARARHHAATMILDRLRRHAGAVAAESSPTRVAEETLRALADAGVPMARLQIIRGGEFLNFGAHGVPAVDDHDADRLLASDWTAAAEMVPGDDAITFRSGADFDARYPQTAALRRQLGAKSGMVLPLRAAAGGVNGVLMAFLPMPTGPEGLADFVGAVGEQCGVALDRALTFEAESRTHTRAQLLAGLLDAMEAAATVQGVAQVLADTLVPRVADYAWVEVRGPGETIAAASHVDSKWRRWVRATPPNAQRRPVDSAALAGILATGQAQSLGPSNEHRRSTAGGTFESDPWAASSRAVVPFRLSGGEGVVVLGLRDRTRRPYRSDDVAFLQEVGERAALRLDNAFLQEQAQDVARRLQLALLPTRLADAHGMEVAACYHPGAHQLHVGGDWYDAIEVDPSRVVFTVGDVVGKGVAAAAVMGRVRSALRALAFRCSDPADILRSLEAYAATIDGAEFATVCCCDLDLATGRLRYVQAGHPPVLLLDPEDGPAFIEDGRTTPLLVSAEGIEAPAERMLKPGSTLLFYSDGLVERRDVSLTEQFERLRQEAELHVDAPLAALPDRIVHALVDGAPTDDVVVLAVRYEGVLATRFQRSYLATPAVLATVRNDVRMWLAEHELERQEEQGLVLAVNEACANAIEHAYLETAEPGVVAVEAAYVDGDITIVVRDNGTWRTNTNGTDRGRGITIMGALTDDLSRESDGTGTTVTLRKRVRLPVTP
jgi:serine phosphatase RsbU (regulator of sigma subunit)/anti-sigma regulatory factor (Ser/Thr protein kinase)